MLQKHPFEVFLAPKKLAQSLKKNGKEFVVSNVVRSRLATVLK